MGKHDISMPQGPLLFALINIHSVETAGAVQGIVHPLVVPPFVRMINLADVGVVGRTEEVDLGQVVGVTEMIHDASVEYGPAIGNVGVPVDVAQEEPESLSLDFPLMSVEGGAFGCLVRVWEFLLGRCFGWFLRGCRGQGAR